MFDLIIMLSRYLFIFYIVLFLWQGIVYVAYEQGGFLGNPYTAVSMQRRITVLMHMTAFLILGYNRETYMFDITTLLFGAISLVFLLFAVKLLDRFYYEGCPLIWTGMLFLMDVSLIILQRVEPSLAHRQLMWMCIGLAGMSFLPTFFRWIPRFVFYLASVFRKRVEWKQFLTTGILSAGLVMLLVLQKDLGSALIFFMTYMVMLYIATSNEFLFFLGMGAASVAAMGAYKLFSHVQVRVAAWRNPWADIDAGGYQIVSSLFAITTWGLFGSGLTKGMPKSIPVVESDMIFSAICEEFGVIFGAGIIGIFIMLLYRGVRIALDCNRRYYSILAAGVTTLISFQAFVILGGVMKLIPLTGVTLPFVSYGGSSVLVSLMMIGLLQWVCVYCEQRAQQEQEEQRMMEEMQMGGGRYE